jgi:hypothetical protein
MFTDVKLAISLESVKKVPEVTEIAWMVASTAVL